MPGDSIKTGDTVLLVAAAASVAARGNRADGCPSRWLSDQSFIQVDYGPDFHRALKRLAQLRLVVFFASDEHQQYLSEALALLAQRDVNSNLATIVCCSDGIHKSLRLNSRVHQLVYQQDATREYLLHVIDQQLAAVVQRHQIRCRRQAELELFGFMARLNQLDCFKDPQFSEFGQLLCQVAGAQHVLVLTPQQCIFASVALDEHITLESLIPYLPGSGACEQQQQNRPAIRVELERNSPLQQALETLLMQPIGVTLVLPIRCYHEVLGWVILVFDTDVLAQVNASLITLVEKLSEQLGSLLERQQSQARLNTQYQRLKVTLEQLNATREQLYHAEKLSSLGELAAGIAHEVNNPVAYVMGNLGPLNDYVSSMVSLLGLYQQLLTTEPVRAAIASADPDTEVLVLQQAIADRLKQDDLEFIVEDVFSVIQDSRQGLERVCDIVNNLRAFARKDDIRFSAVDLQTVLISAERLLNYQIQGAVTLRNEFDLGDQQEALVWGNAGLLGQVFLNLLQNAIHAVEGAGVIEVSLYQGDRCWNVAVRDNGVGIAPELQTQIFDPFFTTKEVGKGTGLGLSTSYGIVNKHQGNIQLQSQVGVGTEFIVSLPSFANCESPAS